MRLRTVLGLAFVALIFALGALHVQAETWRTVRSSSVAAAVAEITSAQSSGSLVLANSAAASTLAPGTVNLPLVSNGPGEAPAYEVLAIAGGGTGQTSAASWPGLAGDAAAVTSTQSTGSLPILNSASITALSPGGIDYPLVSNGPGEDPDYEVLAIAGGGTGQTVAASWPGLAGDAAAVTSTQTTGSLLLANTTGLAAVTPGATASQPLVSQGAGLPPSYSGVVALTSASLGSAAEVAFRGEQTTVTDGVASTVLTITTGPGDMAGAVVHWILQATDGTDLQSQAGTTTVSLVNKAGTVTAGTVGVVASDPAESSGTLTGGDVWTLVTSDANVELQVTANTSLAGATVTVRWWVVHSSDVGVQ